MRELPVVLEKELRRALKQYFGFSKFRANQKEVVQALLGGSDAFVSMPTGGGKSLCYQLAGLLMDGLTVVVSPLIALMQDQVGAAQELGLAAAFLNSSMNEQEIRAVYRRLHGGQIKLLYISPERFASPKFRTRLKEFEPGLCVIDEAHCISEWGHDFRPDYLELSKIRREFPGCRIAAFTATATRTVQDDILKKLKMKDPFVVRASFDRPELFYRVMPKESVLDQILAFVQDRPGKAGIVYRSKRADVEATSEFLQRNGVNARPYHAGLPDETRRRHQEQFVRDETDVIVATIAFGMGIDKSNVRFVVHGDLPKSLEAYYQETGRAGRDGLLSHCLLLFSPGDIRTQRYFIDQIEDAAEAARGRRNLEIMLRYAQSSVCRRTQLLNHFDEEHSGNCGRCDVCTDQASTEDLTVDAQKLLSAVARTGERFGAGHIVDIVKGSDTEKIRERGHDALPTFGVGRGRPKKHWQQVISDLVSRGALVQEGGRYPTLSMSPAGRDILFGRTPFQVVRRKQQAILLKRGGGAKGSGARGAASGAGAAGAMSAARGAAAPEIETELFELLREKRLELSREKGIAPYMVFSDASLEEMASEIPRDRPSFLRINGVGRKKMKQYGVQFIELIDNYARARGYVETRPNTQ